MNWSNNTYHPYEFDSINSLWQFAMRSCLEAGEQIGSRDGSCTEQLGTCFRLLDLSRNAVSVKARKFSLSYAAAETLWYLAGENAIERMQAYAPQYVRFTSDGKTADGAYGHRLYHHAGFKARTAQLQDPPLQSQLHGVVEILKRDPDSRQAVVVMFDASDVATAAARVSKDIPCTLSLQYLIREGKLNCICNMRSNDLWLGLPYDVYAFTSIQRIIARELDLGVGWYQHQAGSSHVYDRDRPKATIALMETSGDSHVASAFSGYAYRCQPSPPLFERPLDLVKHCAIAETLVRKATSPGERTNLIFDTLANASFVCDDLLMDLYLSCCMKWHAVDFPQDHFVSNLLKEIAANVDR